MGMDASANLFYGYKLYDTEDDPGRVGDNLPWVLHEEHNNLEDWYLHVVCGLGPYPSDRKSTSIEVQTWLADRGALPPCPIGLVNSVNLDYPMWFVAIGDGFSTSWDSELEIDPAAMVVDSGVVDDARAFCERWGIPWEEPRWLLTCEHS